MRSRRKQSGRPDLNRRPLGPQPSALPDCATSRRTLFPSQSYQTTPVLSSPLVTRAASYIRTDPDGELPEAEEQRAAVAAYAAAKGYELVAAYEDLEAPGNLLYHRPGLKAAINNIKELEDWEVLLVAHTRCVSDSGSAVHEFAQKFPLYGNRLESPAR